MEIVTEPIKNVSYVIKTSKVDFNNVFQFLDLIKQNLSWALEELLSFNIKSENLEQNYLNIPKDIINRKSLYKIISSEYIKPTLDFEINLNYKSKDKFIKTTKYLLIFGRKLAELLNKSINFDIRVRLFIFKMLLYYEFVTIEDREFYLNNTLFYFGKENNKTNIYNIFLHLKLNKNLNINNFVSSKQYDKDNEVLPKIDLDINKSNLFLPITNITIGLNTFYNPNSVESNNYFYHVYNLIEKLNIGDSNYDTHLNNLLLLLSTNKLSCSYINEFNTHKLDLQTLFNSFGNDTDKSNKLIKENKDLIKYSKYFNGEFTYFKLMIYLNSELNFKILYSNCLNKLQLTNKYFRMPINEFMRVENTDEFISLSSYMTYLSDPHGYCLFYTFLGNVLINKFLNNSFFKIPNINTIFNAKNDIKDKYNIPFTINFEFINKEVNIDVYNNLDNKPYSEIVENLSSIFKSVRLFGRGELYNKYLERLYDNFYVYRLTTFYSYFDRTGEIINPSELKNNGIIFNPLFQSTSFSNSFNYTFFLKPNLILLKIKIHKNSKKWLLLGDYSETSYENEILIDKNSYMLLLEHSYKTFAVEKNIEEILTLEVMLFDTLEELIDYQSNILKSVKQTGGNFKQTSDFSLINLSDSDIEKVKNSNILKNYKNIVINTLYEPSISIHNKFSHLNNLTNLIDIHDKYIQTQHKEKLDKIPNKNNLELLKTSSINKSLNFLNSFQSQKSTKPKLLVPQSLYVKTSKLTGGK